MKLYEIYFKIMNESHLPSSGGKAWIDDKGHVTIVPKNEEHIVFAGKNIQMFDIQKKFAEKYSKIKNIDCGRNDNTKNREHFMHLIYDKGWVKIDWYMKIFYAEMGPHPAYQAMKTLCSKILENAKELQKVHISGKDPYDFKDREEVARFFEDFDRYI